MKTIFLVVVACLAFAAGASAADMRARMPTKAPALIATPVFSWTGVYLGIQGGGGWGTSEGTLTNTTGTFPVPYSLSPSGWLGGAHIGFNYQMNTIVFGVEADIEAADVQDSSNVLASFGVTYHLESRVQTLASVRPRVGVAFDRWLTYVTGGWAWGDVTTEYGFPGSAPFARLSGYRSGWTIGGGIEYAFMANWSAALSYRYTDLGSVSFNDPVANAADSNHFEFHAVRLGISYHF